MKAWLFISALALLCGCAATPPILKADLRPPKDPAEALERYYAERLTPSPEGYRHRGVPYDSYQLPAFYEAQGARQSQVWAERGANFKRGGWWSTVLLFGVGVGISAQADANSPAKHAWWLGILPAGLVGWTFHWVGHGWFTQPSVANYNKDLAEKLGLGMVPNGD